jgi:manganese oxidase
MFTVVKVRADQKPGDYKDSGWFKHPQGTVAYEFTGQLPPAPRAEVKGQGSMPMRTAPGNDKKDVEVQIRKPSGAGGHGKH